MFLHSWLLDHIYFFFYFLPLTKDVEDILDRRKMDESELYSFNETYKKLQVFLIVGLLSFGIVYVYITLKIMNFFLEIYKTYWL